MSYIKENGFKRTKICTYIENVHRKSFFSNTGSFRIGELVWGKMKGHPTWPSRIVLPPDELKRPAVKKLLHCVQFFGTHDFAWITEEDVKPYSKFREANLENSKVPSFKKAIKEIDAVMVMNQNMINIIKEPVKLESVTTPANAEVTLIETKVEGSPLPSEPMPEEPKRPANAEGQ